jgi:NAD(P)-dependent dehydrogenase (short-subunit alcohol dehydrogenase family)
MKIDLSGQTILVTGASRGIGAGIARQLGNSGARVAIHYGKARAEAEALAKEIGQGAEVFSADLGTSDGPTALWNAVMARFGRVDALVNNAGIYLEAPLAGSAEDWLAGWEKTMAVNLTAAGLLCRAAILAFQTQGGGRIVNIASRAAFRGDDPDYLAYAASKAGMVALTKSIARGFGKDNIKAFAIAPGFTRTDMATAYIAQYGEAAAVGDNALGRMPEVSDIAPAVTFFLSGMADQSTGTTVDVNGATYVR